MSMATFELPFPDTWLPRKPLSSSTKTGGYKRRSRDKALELPYIEANPLSMRSLIITDRDTSDADQAAELAGLPRPSYVAMNPHTTSGHIVYALEKPVCLTDAAKRRPINLLARIEHGINAVLGGDVSYGGRITKNPTHNAHATLWGPEEALYSLSELAEALETLKALPKPGNPRKNVTTSIVGRNCGLFDMTRAWAYREIKKYWTTTTQEWETAVQQYATQINATVIANEFTAGPLDTNETTHLARSVARWTRRNFTAEKFSAIQKNRYEKGLLKINIDKQQKRSELLAQIEEFSL